MSASTATELRADAAAVQAFAMQMRGPVLTHGLNYERLRKLKAKYDPTNLFRMNLNIPAPN